MESYSLIPKVDETQEFIEIANDFSNPLDLIREAISNSYDAEATEIRIGFYVITEYGENKLKIEIEDNGLGMDGEALQSFFDLGNSTRRDNPNAIGEKGHGTKVYFNSRKIEICSKNNSVESIAIMNEPYRNLIDRKIPTVEVTKQDCGLNEHGTKIIIYGYNNSQGKDKFTHAILKDYIMWFTKHGSFENIFNYDMEKTKLLLKGLDRDEYEAIENGHFFPEDSISLDSLLDNYLTKAPNHYAKRVIKSGNLKNNPQIKYNAIFCIEGTNVKYSYNPMLRRRGYSAPEGAYTVSDRYGLWLAKDFIPIQRKNEWIIYKGSEHTKFHAFFNCQELSLTANRGSADNTSSEIMQDIKYEVEKIYNDITESEDWFNMTWLESEASAHQTVEKERRNFEYRIKKVNKSNICKYKSVVLVEPEREIGVFSVFMLVSSVEPNLFPFQIIDYDTHDGIDVIAKGDKSTPLVNAKLFYIEFKHTLEKKFNHSFEHLNSIVCWNTSVKHDEILKDIQQEERKMEIVPPRSDEDYTRYFLSNPRKAHKIEVYVLKQFLKEKVGLEFVPRTKNAIH